MENIAEKIAYLQGLAEGLGVNEETNEGRIINGILDILKDMNEYIGELDDDLFAVETSVEEISEDLSDVEDKVYGECDGDCDSCDECDFDEDDYNDDDIYEIECPECGQLVYADSETLDEEEIYCPNCHKKVDIEIPDEEEE